MTTQEIQNRAESLMRKRTVRCDCGGPQCGTGHAPDCALLLAWDDAFEDAREELYEEYCILHPEE